MYRRPVYLSISTIYHAMVVWSPYYGQYHMVEQNILVSCHLTLPRGPPWVPIGLTFPDSITDCRTEGWEARLWTHSHKHIIMSAAMENLDIPKPFALERGWGALWTSALNPGCQVGHRMHRAIWNTWANIWKFVQWVNLGIRRRGHCSPKSPCH